MSEENVEIVRRAFEAVNRRDFDDAVLRADVRIRRLGGGPRNRRRVSGTRGYAGSSWAGSASSPASVPRSTN